MGSEMCIRDSSSPVDQSGGRCLRVSRYVAETDAVAMIDAPHQSRTRKPISKGLPADRSWVCFGECNPQDPNLSTLASIEPLSIFDTDRPHIISPSLLTHHITCCDSCEFSLRCALMVLDAIALPVASFPSPLSSRLALSEAIALPR